MSFEGGCLCGAVRYRASADPIACGHCHCNDCRRSSGTGHCSHLALPQAAFAVTGDVKFFDKPADSGNVVSRGFCPSCGAAIYSRNAGMAGMVFIRASSLDDPEVFRPQMVVYGKRAPSWDHMDDTLPCFEGAPSPEDMANMGI